MATDVNVAFGHNVAFPPTESVAECMRKGIVPVHPRFSNNWTLRLDHNPGRGLVCVQSSLSVLFGPHAAIIPTGYRWPGPRQEPDEELISAVSAIARYFQSARIIILPDDIEPWFYASKWIGDGLTLDELEQRLAELKPPALTFKPPSTNVRTVMKWTGTLSENYEAEHGLISAFTLERFYGGFTRHRLCFASRGTFDWNAP